MIVLDAVARETRLESEAYDRSPATSRYEEEFYDYEGGYDGEPQEDSRMRAKNGMYHFHTSLHIVID